MTSHELERVEEGLNGFVVRLLQVVVPGLPSSVATYSVSIESGTTVCFAQPFDYLTSARSAMQLAVVGLRLGLPRPEP